jgi:hypothetical protein
MHFRQPHIFSFVFKVVMHALYNLIHCFQEQGKPPGASLASSLTPTGRATHRGDLFIPVQWRTGKIYSSRYSGAPGRFIHPGTVAHRGDLFIPVHWRTGGFILSGTLAYRRIHPIRNGRTHPCSSHIKIPSSSIQTFELVHHPLLTNPPLNIGKMRQLTSSA